MSSNKAVLKFEFISYTVKSHFKALSLYNLIRGFGLAYKRVGGRGGLYPAGLISGTKKCFGTTR